LSEDVMAKLEKLSQDLTSLQHQLERLNKEAEHWADKRNTIHTQIKDLRIEAAKAREQRNTANTKAKALKTKRNQTRALSKDRKAESKQLTKTLQLLNKKKPKRPVDAVKREKEQIEWQIQTSSLTLQEERRLVEQVNQLETQLGIYEEIDNARQKIRELQDTVEKMNAVAAHAHTGVLELAQKSQEFHQRAMSITERVEVLQKDADAAHQNFVASRRKARKFYEEYVEVKQRIKSIKEELAEKEEKEKRERREDMRKKMKAEAREKLEKGGKLTWEEFKLLDEQPT
jgi:uncharacterized coiled-coil DUF342 family protein